MLLTLLLNILFQDQVEMADSLRTDGKFWVVVLVIASVTTGIMIYLFMLDRKVRKLEDKK